LFSCHICHPSLANDNLSGIAVATILACHLRTLRLRHSYRFLFIPGTIGSLTWLARNEDKLGNIVHGLVLSCLGDSGGMTYKQTRRGNAKNGVYSPATSQFAGTDMFDRLTETEIEELFDKEKDSFAIKSWIKEGIRWHVGDVSDLEIVSALGPQDIVVANNFLCHMNAPMAERCLRNIARLVAPHGYLFVSGVDLDVRTKIAKELGWNPVQELLEEIYEGDPRMASGWPFNYSSLEPLNKRTQKWRLRYAAAFQLNSFAESENQRTNTAA
jgi:SAM-dependent methyltransferase